MRAGLLVAAAAALACTTTQVFEPPRRVDFGSKREPRVAKSRWRLHIFVAGHDRLAASWLGGFQSGWAPVNAYVLEHPTLGLVVFDTGLSRRVATERQYCHCFSTPVVEYRLERGEDLPSQMAAAGLSPSLVRTVVLSHPHADHTGEVSAFAHAEIFISQPDLEWAKRRGSLVSVHRWEFEKAPRLTAVQFEGFPLTVFRTLSDDYALSMTPLPGHTPGSLGLVAHLANGPVLLSGDAWPSRAFAEWAMKNGRVGRVQHNQRRALDTIALIDGFARAMPNLAVLGAHEAELPQSRADIVVHTFRRRQVTPATAPATAPAPEPRAPLADRSRADLFILPAVAFAGTTGLAQSAAGGLSYELLPCLAVETTAIATFRFGGSTRRMSATSVAARLSLEIAPDVLLFLTMGAGLLVIENAAMTAFDPHAGITLSAGGLWYLTDSLGLRLELFASTPLTDSDFRWPPFRLVTVCAGIVLRL